MEYQVTHRTTYEYDDAVAVSHHVAHLTPRDLGEAQQCLEHRWEIEPGSASTHREPDYFGNLITRITVESPHRRLNVLVHSRVRVTSPSPLRPGATLPWDQVADRARDAGPDALGWAEFIHPSPLVPRHLELLRYAGPSFPSGRPVLEAALDLMGRIHADFKFDPAATTIATPLEQVWRTRRGVCQDFAHFAIGCLRALGLPARYVSGYLETDPPPGKPKLQGADASHAWLELRCGPAGWVGLDPTNNLMPGDRHVVLAWGRDFGDVSPMRGIIVGGGAHRLAVAVDVTPIPPAEPEP